MARKLDSKPKEENKPASVPSGSDAKAVKEFARRIKRAKSDMDEARGTVGQIYEEVEDKGLHRKALKDAIRLSEMEATKAQDYLRSLEQYCHILGVKAQLDLVDQIKGDGKADDEDVSGPEFSSERTEGRVSALNDRPLQDANPYQEGTPHHRAFVAGYQDGEKERAAIHGKPRNGQAAGAPAH